MSHPNFPLASEDPNARATLNSLPPLPSTRNPEPWEEEPPVQLDLDGRTFVSPAPAKVIAGSCLVLAGLGVAALLGIRASMSVGSPTQARAEAPYVVPAAAQPVASLEASLPAPTVVAPIAAIADAPTTPPRVDVTSLPHAGATAPRAAVANMQPSTPAALPQPQAQLAPPAPPPAATTGTSNDATARPETLKTRALRSNRDGTVISTAAARVQPPVVVAPVTPIARSVPPAPTDSPDYRPTRPYEAFPPVTDKEDPPPATRDEGRASPPTPSDSAAPNPYDDGRRAPTSTIPGVEAH